MPRPIQLGESRGVVAQMNLDLDGLYWLSDLIGYGDSAGDEIRDVILHIETEREEEAKLPYNTLEIGLDPVTRLPVMRCHTVYPGGEHA